MSGEGRGDMREESVGNGDRGSEKVRCREKRRGRRQRHSVRQTDIQSG